MGGLPPSGPVYLSGPYDDWAAEADPQSSALLDRQVHAVGSFDGLSLSRLVERLNAAKNPALVLGPEVDACRANPLAVRLPEKLRAPRSEEHTSELQSHLNLVCLLLLQKK